VKIEQSVGAVIKYKTSLDNMEHSEFLLLKNRRGYWGFPQGHREKGETEIQTLTREVNEETGIVSIEILSFIGKINYSFFKSDGMKSNKEVSFYFATTPTRSIKLSEEHDDYIWTTFEEAMSYLDHRQLRLIMLKGHKKGLY